MALYHYSALDRSGRRRQGEVEQPTVDQVVDWLAGEGLTPLEIREVSGPGARQEQTRGSDPSAAVSLSRLWPGRRKVRSRDRALHMARDLSVMLTSGLPLDKSLVLLEQMTDPEGARLIADLRNDLRRGVPLADAFEARAIFSPFFISMIRAGDLSGTLEQTLARLADYLEKARLLRQTIAAALTYPVILLVVSLLSLMLLLAYVVPGFADLFSDMGGELPGPTRLVMHAGDFMSTWWWLLLGMGVVMVAGARRLWAQPAVRSRVDRRLLGWPLVGELICNLETARFSRTLGVLLQGGVSLVPALKIARETVANTTLRQDLEAADGALREGRSLSGHLITCGRFPLLATNMIQVGEETGRLEDMLLKVSDIYEGEVSDLTRRLLALLEPLLILTLGVMIAGIIVAILLGILGVNELIG